MQIQQLRIRIIFDEFRSEPEHDVLEIKQPSALGIQIKQHTSDSKITDLRRSPTKP